MKWIFLGSNIRFQTSSSMIFISAKKSQIHLLSFLSSLIKISTSSFTHRVTPHRTLLSGIAVAAIGVCKRTSALGRPCPLSHKGGQSARQREQGRLSEGGHRAPGGLSEGAGRAVRKEPGGLSEGAGRLVRGSRAACQRDQGSLSE